MFIAQSVPISASLVARSTIDPDIAENREDIVHDEIDLQEMIPLDAREDQTRADRTDPAKTNYGEISRATCPTLAVSITLFSRRAKGRTSRRWQESTSAIYSENIPVDFCSRSSRPSDGIPKWARHPPLGRYLRNIRYFKAN